MKKSTQNRARKRLEQRADALIRLIFEASEAALEKNTTRGKQSPRQKALTASALAAQNAIVTFLAVESFQD